jgi:hypothetical protein
MRVRFEYLWDVRVWWQRWAAQRQRHEAQQNMSFATCSVCKPKKHYKLPDEISKKELR